jgi:hypothetical protein
MFRMRGNHGLWTQRTAWRQLDVPVSLVSGAPIVPEKKKPPPRSPRQEPDELPGGALRLQLLKDEKVVGTGKTGCGKVGTGKVGGGLSVGAGPFDGPWLHGPLGGVRMSNTHLARRITNTSGRVPVRIHNLGATRPAQREGVFDPFDTSGQPSRIFTVPMAAAPRDIPVVAGSGIVPPMDGSGDGSVVPAMDGGATPAMDGGALFTRIGKYLERLPVETMNNSELLTEIQKENPMGNNFYEFMTDSYDDYGGRPVTFWNPQRIMMILRMPEPSRSQAIGQAEKYSVNTKTRKMHAPTKALIAFIKSQMENPDIVAINRHVENMIDDEINAREARRNVPQAGRRRTHAALLAKRPAAVAKKPKNKRKQPIPPSDEEGSEEVSEEPPLESDIEDYSRLLAPSPEPVPAAKKSKPKSKSKSKSSNGARAPRPSRRDRGPGYEEDFSRYGRVVTKGKRPAAAAAAPPAAAAALPAAAAAPLAVPAPAAPADSHWPPVRPARRHVWYDQVLAQMPSPEEVSRMQDLDNPDIDWTSLLRRKFSAAEPVDVQKEYDIDTEEGRVKLLGPDLAGRFLWSAYYNKFEDSAHDLLFAIRPKAKQKMVRDAIENPMMRPINQAQQRFDLVERIARGLWLNYSRRTRKHHPWLRWFKLDVQNYIIPSLKRLANANPGWNYGELIEHVRIDRADLPHDMLSISGGGYGLAGDGYGLAGDGMYLAGLPRHGIVGGCKKCGGKKKRKRRATQSGGAIAPDDDCVDCKSHLANMHNRIDEVLSQSTVDPLDPRVTQQISELITKTHFGDRNVGDLKTKLGHAIHERIKQYVADPKGTPMDPGNFWQPRLMDLYSPPTDIEYKQIAGPTFVGVTAQPEYDTATELQRPSKTKVRVGEKRAAPSAAQEMVTPVTKRIKL